MKKCFLAFIILITSLCFGQTNNDVIVTVAGASPVILESQKLWSNTSINTYIYKPIKGYSIQNLYIRSRLNGGGRPYTVSVFETSDSSVTGFNSSTCGVSGTLACSSFWNSVPVSGTACVNGGGINSNTTLNCQFLIHSTGLIALKFDQTTGGGGTGNYDLILDFVDSSNIQASLLFGATSGDFSLPKPVNVDSSGNLNVNGTNSSFPITIFGGSSSGNAGVTNESTANNNKNALTVEKGNRWGLNSSPAAGVVATATQASCGATCLNVIDCIGFSSSASAAVAATNVTISVVDSNAVTLWQLNVDIPVTAGVGGGITPFGLCGLNIPASGVNFGMTCKFSAAVANAIESINCSGYGAN